MGVGMCLYAQLVPGALCLTYGRGQNNDGINNIYNQKWFLAYILGISKWLTEKPKVQFQRIQIQVQNPTRDK